MIDFYEYLARRPKMGLPDTHTMLAMAGVPLGTPGREETQRLLDRDRKQSPAGGKAHKSVVPLDSQPSRTARERA